MHIDEFKAGSQAMLNVKAGGHTFEFNTKILTSGCTKSGHYIGCQLIIINNRILDPGGHQANIDIHNPDDGRKYNFLLRASAIDKKHRIMYLYSTEDAKAKNFRGAFRIPCGYKVVLQIGINRTIIDGHVHDLSYTGASYIFATDAADVSEGDAVSGSIYDFEEHIYRTNGTIVRILDEFGPGLTLIGVKFEKDVNLQGLVSRLQRNELRIRGKP